MKTTLLSAAFAVGLFVSATGHAQVPASAPAGTTALCKDGTYFSGATKKGACKGHKGVNTWYGAGSQPAAAMAPAAASKPAAAMPAAASTPPAKSAAAGGGPGQVWVNTSTKVYHCPTDKYYGKTKNGQYMSEADAKAKGFHADHGKACQST